MKISRKSLVGKNSTQGAIRNAAPTMTSIKSQIKFSGIDLLDIKTPRGPRGDIVFPVLPSKSETQKVPVKPMAVKKFDLEEEWGVRIEIPQEVKPEKTLKKETRSSKEITETTTQRSESKDLRSSRRQRTVSRSRRPSIDNLIKVVQEVKEVVEIKKESPKPEEKKALPELNLEYKWNLDSNGKSQVKSKIIDRGGVKIIEEASKVDNSFDDDNSWDS